jgi:nucleotide-binding universal stress UspA family protein
MSTILVVANETLAGAKLLETVKERAAAGGEGTRVIVCVPRNKPKHGNIIYDDFVFDAAKVRIDLARRFLRDEGITAIGDIGDPDPYTATLDAVAEHHPDEIIVSTYPATVSGWLRRDLIERIEQASGLPVTHCEQDIDAEGIPFHVTLAVAAKTASGDELLNALKAKAEAADRRSLFIVIVPQEGGEGQHAARARARMAQVVDRLVSEGLIAAGMIGDPDPYTATMNALQFFRVDDIVISTLPATRSGWLRADLIDRVRKVTNKPVEHIEASERTPSAAA